jgi:hypothetical protein
MRIKTVLFVACVTLFAMVHVSADIGSTIRESQREYGSRGTYATPNNSAIAWHYRDWTVTEYYNPEGYCNSVIYRTRTGAFFTDSDISTILRANTPPGVAWRQLHTNQTIEVFVRNWSSTEYVVNGFVFSLVANLSFTIAPDAVPDANGVTPTSWQLSIHVQ